MKKDLVSF